MLGATTGIIWEMGAGQGSTGRGLGATAGIFWSRTITWSRMYWELGAWSSVVWMELGARGSEGWRGAGTGVLLGRYPGFKILDEFLDISKYSHGAAPI